jgi:excisionase family DNA binding protein
MFASSKRAAEYYGVSGTTLRRWAKSGKLEHEVTSGGHHRFLLKETERAERRKIIYARVSSAKQEKDLDRQVKYMERRFNCYEVIRDIGGGANFKRKGLQSLLESVCRGEVETIAVYSKDRLTRFGGELIEFICGLFNTAIVYVEREEEGSGQTEELSKDLLTIITHFTAKYYGSRKYDSDS